MDAYRDIRSQAIQSWTESFAGKPPQHTSLAEFEAWAAEERRAAEQEAMLLINNPDAPLVTTKSIRIGSPKERPPKSPSSIAFLEHAFGGQSTPRSSLKPSSGADTGRAEDKGPPFPNPSACGDHAAELKLGWCSRQRLANQNAERRAAYLSHEMSNDSYDGDIDAMRKLGETDYPRDALTAVASAAPVARRGHASQGAPPAAPPGRGTARGWSPHSRNEW